MLSMPEEEEEVVVVAARGDDNNALPDLTGDAVLVVLDEENFLLSTVPPSSSCWSWTEIEPPTPAVVVVHREGDKNINLSDNSSEPASSLFSCAAG